jgi:hypothetical protein
MHRVGHGCIAWPACWLQMGGSNLEVGAKSLGRTLEGGWWGSKVMMAQRGGREDDAALLVLSCE